MEEATWESESSMRAQYLQLFSSGINFEEKILLRGENSNTPNYTLVFLLHVYGIIKVKFVFFENLSVKYEK